MDNTSIRVCRKGVNMVVDAFDIQEGDLVTMANGLVHTANCAIEDDETGDVLICVGPGGIHAWPIGMFIRN